VTYGKGELKSNGGKLSPSVRQFLAGQMLAYPDVAVCLIPVHFDPPIWFHGDTEINEGIIQQLSSY
jgi:hypothetical protein